MIHTRDTGPAAHGPTPQPALRWAAYAAALVYTEMLGAFRSSLWLGLDRPTAAGVVMGFLLYAAILAAAASLIHVLARPLVRDRELRAVLSHGLAAAALAAGLYAQSAHGGPHLFALTLVFFALIACVDCVLLWRQVPFARVASLLWLGVYGAAAIALVGSNAFFFLNEERADLVALASLSWWFFCTLLFPMVYGMGRAVGPWLHTTLIAGVGAAPGFAVLLTAGALPAGHEGGPNLLLVTADALRADRCSAYGGEVATPNLEALAQEGAIFERGYALAPWTMPSLFALFSSRHAPGLSPSGSLDDWKREMTRYTFDPTALTLAERLAEAGYDTAAYVGNSLLRDRTGILRGFQQAGIYGHRTPIRTGIFAGLPLLQDAVFRIAPGLVEERPCDTTRILTQQAQRYLVAHAKRPFFLWIHLMDPHAAFAPPARHRPAGVAWPIYCNADPHWGTPQTDARGVLTLTTGQQADVRALYDGEVRYVDEALGDILRTLDAAGLREKTVVCFTSDHGEEFWEHGDFGHGHSLYDELVRVPWVLAGPGIAPQRIAEPVSHLDLMPTFAQLLNVEPDARWRGVSLVEALGNPGAPRPDRPVFAQSTNLYSAHGPLQMAIVRDHKLIRSLRDGYEALFDLRSDVADRHNLLEQRGALANELRAALTEWSATLPLRVEEEAGQFLDADTAERLRSFGYIH